ncbi:MAG: hypothetical protein HQK53_17885, partial [Oligoflexia bacterium]|nr:hypothetical protein [Oligoflexia bacterium]
EHAFIIEGSNTIHKEALPATLLNQHRQYLEQPVKSMQRSTTSSNDDMDNADAFPPTTSGNPDTLHSNNHFIDIQAIKNSVLDENQEHIDNRVNNNSGNYNFSFCHQDGKLDFQAAKDLFEKEFITEALKVNKGKINQTALKANIPKKTLLRKIEKYTINPREFCSKY